MNNSPMYKAAIIAALYISFFGISACSQMKKPDSDVKSYELTVNYPILWDKMELDNKKDTFPIFYYKDYCVYMIRYTYSLTIDGKQTENEKRYRYFIYKQNEKYGYYYNDTNDSVNYKEYVVDTFLFKYACAMKFDNGGLKLVSATTDKNKNILLEKYIVPVEHGVYTFDSVYYYFDEKMNDCPYSFSKYQDSLKGAKLYSGRYLFNERYSEADKATVPKREYYFTISEVPLKNKQKILELVALFEVTHGQFKTTHKDL